MAAHGSRAALAFYGDFGPSAARCQRVIARAASRCIAEVINARRACLSAQMDGAACDSASADAAVQAARKRASDRVFVMCQDQDATLLQFNNVDEAQTDVATLCSDLETAAVSAAFGPALGSGSVAAVDGVQRVCMDAAAGEVARLLRVATAVWEAALGRIVAVNLAPSAKIRLVQQAQSRLVRARAAAAQRIGMVCTGAEFATVYGRRVDTLLSSVADRGSCMASGVYVLNTNPIVEGTVLCPPAVCGNGIQEPGESCDDGNQYDGDACHNDCTKNNCDFFPSTFDLIQNAIFENHGCTNSLCHGISSQGGLDLRADAAYAALVDAPSTGSTLKRVEPGDEERSFLWLKLAAATLGRTGVPGSPMPQGLPPLSENELEAMRRWIYAGAPRDGVVAGTADLLNACLPPPQPLQIRPAEAPAPGTGVQLHMPQWTVPANGESEVCFAAYYDLTDQVPAQFRSADGKALRFNRQETTQDPLSHHLVTNYYQGQYAADDPVWGPYTCRSGAHLGDACNPLTSGACGPGGECATTPLKSIACIGFGAPDSQIDIRSLGAGGTQKTVSALAFPDGVYDEIPLKGIVLWNSHAFNLTATPGKLEAWLNFYFAPPIDQQHPVQHILDTTKVFAMNVPPFQTQEVCNVHVVETGAQLFQITSHMHKRGKRFRIFRGAFQCQGGDHDGAACPPTGPDLCAGAPCVDPTGRGAAASLMYTSLIYNDPVALLFDPPLTLSGGAADRSFTYCALYDNGATNPAEVKRKSTSPAPPFNIGFGGPCATPTHCVAGAPRAPCSGHNQTQRNASCDSSPGAGDGLCDACPLTGGVTTEDEMFILLGEYFLP